MLWLVRDGKPYYCESYDIERPSSWFLDQTAPRTFIGNDAAGRFYLFVVRDADADAMWTEFFFAKTG